MRDKLDEQVKEFEAIVKPLDSSRIIFLGTPQCEDSIYNKLRERGYNARIWTSEYITPDTNQNVYDGAVSPFIAESTNETGKSTEPLRFTDVDLEERKLSYGRSGYALQFMLNPRLSDTDRYPLKINDLIVHDLDNELANEKYVWASGTDQVIHDVPNVGFNGDRFFRPFETLGDMVEYTGSVMSIDPSGRGRDETAYAVVKMLNGQLFVHACNGINGGYGENVLKELTNVAKRYNVNEIIVESNMGDGMFTELFKPIINATYPVTINEVRHNVQKERRIIDTLEPVMNAHKLIMDTDVIRKDYQSALAHPIEKQTRYMLLYQLTRITKDRGALLQDDRLDALAIAVAYWVEQMAQDVTTKMNNRRSELMKEELERFTNSFHKQNNKQLSTTWI
jgi:hypothetical protein